MSFCCYRVRIACPKCFSLHLELGFSDGAVQFQFLLEPMREHLRQKQYAIHFGLCEFVWINYVWRSPLIFGILGAIRSPSLRHWWWLWANSSKLIRFTWANALDLFLKTVCLQFYKLNLIELDKRKLFLMKSRSNIRLFMALYEFISKDSYKIGCYWKICLKFVHT